MGMTDFREYDKVRWQLIEAVELSPVERGSGASHGYNIGVESFVGIGALVAIVQSSASEPFISGGVPRDGEVRPTRTTPVLDFQNLESPTAERFSGGVSEDATGQVLFGLVVVPQRETGVGNPVVAI